MLLHGRGANEATIIGLADHLPVRPGYTAVRAPIAEGNGDPMPARGSAGSRFGWPPAGPGAAAGQRPRAWSNSGSRVSSSTTAQTQPSTGQGPTVSRASLQADLLAAQQRTLRIAARTRQLETRLSELLGEKTWRASGLGAPDDIDQLNHRIITLEQQTIDLQLQLDERTQDLDAARAANRALMSQINATPTVEDPQRNAATDP